MHTPIFSPVIQYGFAGLCVILLGVIVWLVRRLLDQLDHNSLALERNTVAIRALEKIVDAAWRRGAEQNRR